MFYDLGLQRTRAGRAVLTLARYPYSPEGVEGQTDKGDLRAPMPSTSRLAFRYFGSQGEDEAPSWSDHWEQSAYLPQLVEIRMQSVWALSPRSRSVIVPLRLYQKAPAHR